MRGDEMKVIIDRFEEDFAVVELDGEMLRAPRALFAGAEEGDAVLIQILGKNADLGEDEHPHEIFERLRKKHRREG